MTLTKQGAFTFDHSNQQDDLYKVKTALEIKQALDSRGIDLKNTINNLIDALQSFASGDSGAKYIGAESITGLIGNNVQTLLGSLKTLIDTKSNSTDVYSKNDLLSATDGSSGADKVKATPIATSPDTIQGILEWLKIQIDNMVLGQISDGSLTDVKLSNAPTEIKQSFITHKAENASLTTKGHVQLQTTVDTSETKALTPKALNDHKMDGTVHVAVGTIIWVARNTAPNGYLKANGAALSRTTYSDLFATIGTTFGVGDGSTTFNLPDLRGEFIRGWDDTRGVDSGRSFGSSQADDLKSHQHSMASYNTVGTAPSIASGSSVAGPVKYTDYTGGNETRPRNVALLACIKY